MYGQASAIFFNKSGLSITRVASVITEIVLRFLMLLLVSELHRTALVRPCLLHSALLREKLARGKASLFPSLFLSLVGLC